MSWLVSCSIKATLLLVASWAGASLLRRNTAAARHQIWMLGVVGALLLPLSCWALPSLPLPWEVPGISGTSLLEAPAVLVTAGARSPAAPTWPAWLATVWAFGTILATVRLLRGHLAARRLAVTAEPALAESWSVALRDAAAALALTRHIELRRSDAVGSPMMLGVLHPCVLLPTAADSWSRERIHAVLLHELAHVRRHDTIIQLAAQLACAVYWWNPLAWLAAARLRVEREHACDDIVLDAGILPSAYATDLLEVARSLSVRPVAAACMVDASGTEARLHHILDTATPRRPLRARFRIAATALALGCVVTLACTSSPPPAIATRVPHGTLSMGAPFARSPYPFGAPVAGGVVDLSVVATEVKRHIGSLEQCYERRLAVNPALAGTVVVHWVIAENGNVVDACVTEDTVRDHELVACVNQLVLGRRFPAPRGGTADVSFPFVFSPET